MQLVKGTIDFLAAINRICAKGPLITGEPKAAQPFYDIHRPLSH